MSRASTRGPRRTRVYDCNYRAGQNYYKPALDSIDRKYYGRPLEPEPFQSPIRAPAFNDPLFNEPLENSRRRAERVITDDSFFDVRGARVPKSSIGAAIDDFDEDVRSSLSRIRANKKTATNFNTDVDFDDTIDAFKRRARFNDGPAENGFGSSSSRAATSIKKSSVKVSSRQEEDNEPLSITKWSAVKKSNDLLSTDDSGASMRAQATKARLNDLESEMFERSEKQLARELRSQQLKQFLAESDIELGRPSL